MLFVYAVFHAKASIIRGVIMKKRSNRILLNAAAVMACVILVPFIFSACTDAETGKSVFTPTTAAISTFPESFLDSDGLAFTVTGENLGPYKWGCDYWTRASYFVYYNGTIEIRTTYTLSGESVVTKDISYTDLKRIRVLAEDFKNKKDMYDLDFSNTYDGSTWSFYTYDLDGSRSYVYSGYIYGLNELEGIKKTLARYDVKETYMDRAYDLFEGRYVCPDDDQQYVSVYKNDGQIFLEIRQPGARDAELYEISDVELSEDYIYFGYVEDNRWKGFYFTYSVGKTQIQNTDTSVTYVRQAEK
jgi:hypothetical protein